MGLSGKQRAFINEYLIDFNATRAAQRAGYRGNDATLASIGSENLRKPEIADAIDQRLSEDAMRPAEILKRLGEQARAKHSDYLTDTGAVDFPRLIADGKAHLIKSIKDTAQGRHIEFYDAQAALNLLGKHQGIFTDKTDVTVHGDMNITNDDMVQAAKELADWLKNSVSSASKSSG